MEFGCLGGYLVFFVIIICDKFILRVFLERLLGNIRNGLFDYIFRVRVILSLWIFFYIVF